MSEYKKEFDLYTHMRNKKGGYDPVVFGKVNIIPKRGKRKPIVLIRNITGSLDYYIDGRDLRKFAENILRTIDEH